MGKRPKTKGELTIRTAIPAQKKRAGKAIEIDLYEPMPPNPPMAPGAVRGSGPGKKFAPLENLLDADIHLE